MMPSKRSIGRRDVHIHDAQNLTVALDGWILTDRITRHGEHSLRLKK